MDFFPTLKVRFSGLGFVTAKILGFRLKVESWIAIAFVAFFGGGCLLLVPPLITYDGPGHFYRSVQVSEGTLRPDKASAVDVGGTVPKRYGSFVDVLWNSYWEKHNFGNRRYWAALSRETAPDGGRRRIAFTNIAIYSPENYVFQALGIRCGKAFSRSPLLAERLAGVCNLLGYLLIIVLALEAMPFFERTLLLVATSPLLIVQAASVSADGINFALPALLLAFVARFRFVGPNGLRSSVWGVLLLAFAVAQLKPLSLCFSGIVILIPAEAFGGFWKKSLVLGTLAVAVVASWWWWNHPYFDVDLPRFFDSRNHSSALTKAWFLKNPLRFLPALKDSLAHETWGEWTAFFGSVGGWITAGAIKYQAALSVVLLLSILACGSSKGPVDPVWAGSLLLQALVLFCGTALVLWLSYATVGERKVPYLGGRYLFLVYFVFLLSVAEFTKRFLPAWTSKCLWPGLAANAAFLVFLLGGLGARTF